MRIALVTTSFRPFEWRSGISNVVFLTAMGLKERGNEVRVFSPHYSGLQKIETRNSLTVERFRHRHAYFAYSREAREMIEGFKPDIVHSFHYGFYPANAGLKAAERLSIPHIFTPAYHPPIYSPVKNVLLKTYDKFYGKKLVQNSDKLIVFNNNEKKQMQAFGAKKIDIVPAPVNNDAFFLRRKQHKKITIIYTGSFLPWKGAGIAMNIFKRIERKYDVNFFYAGGGPMLDELKKRGGQNFRFFIDRPTRKLGEIYNTCDIMVSPTYYESFGCTLAEAAMCGVPAVTTRVGAVPETVGPGGLLVDYGDWQSMESHIESLVEDSKLRKRLSAAAIRHSSQYKKDKVVKKIIESYGDN